MRTSFLMGGEMLFSLPHWYKYTVSPLHKNLLSFKLSNMWTCPGKRPMEKKGRRSNWRTRRFTVHEMARQCSLFEEALFVFEAQDPKLRMVHEGYSSHSESNPVLPCHLRWENKELLYYSDISGSFLQEGRINETSKETRTCAINLRCEWNCSLPSISYCWWSFSSTVFPPSRRPPVSNSSFLFTWCQLLYASCYIALLYF